MTKQLLTMLIVSCCAGTASARWQPVAGDAGGANIEVVEQSRTRTIVNVTLPGIEITPVVVAGRVFEQLSIPGDVMATIEVGRPQVPKLALLLATPGGAQVTVRATVEGAETFKVGDVYPLQPPQLDSRPEPPFTINEEAYREDAAFPGYDVSLIETGTWRDLDVANIQVYPVQVNAARGEITVAKRVRIEVSYAGGRYPASVPDWLYPTYAAFVDNFRELGLEPRVDYDAGVRYLVLCHQNHAGNSLLNDSLLGWVHQRGYEVRKVVKTSFTAQEVKDSIRAEYNRQSPAVLQYVLLVGEHAEIPTGTYSGVGKSDFWYMDIEPWPAGDNYPEVSLARLSPASSADLDNQVRKILKYQKAPVTTGNWLDRMTLVAHREEYPGKYSGCVRGAYHMPKPYWQPMLDTIMGQFRSNADVTNALNAGVGILAYRGHGDATIWAGWCGSNWTNADVHALANGDMTPVTQHWACICGDISVSECHAEAWMRKYPGGAVSALAATQASYTLPNHGQCSTVVRSMTDTWTITVPGTRDYLGPVFSAAGQMSYMDAYLAKYWPSSPYYYNIWMYLTLGDPAMPVWAGTPAIPTVSYPDSIPTGPYNLGVDVTVNGYPVEGALVCAWRDGEFYVVERTDATGAAILAVSASSPGEVRITVSEGHARRSTPGVAHTPILPHEGFTMAGGGTAQPSVRYVSNRVDDSGGNNNSRFDPGETADIIVTVRNNGNAPAENLTGRLRAYHAEFTVIDSTAGFGTLAAGSDTNNAHDRFTASAGSGIPGGTSVQCSLYLHSDRWGEWTWGFRLPVGVPPVPPQYIITLDTGAVRLSVCGIGSIGYDEPPADAGSGFQVPKNSASALFFGSLMAGNSEGWLVDHHFGRPANGPTNRDWTMTDSFRLQVPAAPADVHWRGAMSDAGHPTPKGLDVTWDWYMTAQGGYDDWAVVELHFANGGAADIDGMYVGFIGDFDIGSSSTNLAASDEARRAVWMRQASGENPCVGFALLNPSTFANLTAVDHDLYVYPDSAMNDGMKWRLLDGTIALRQSNRSYDWSVLVSAGPFDLAQGETERVAFAVVGGLNAGEFRANVDSAQRWYDAHLLGLQEAPLAAGRQPFFLSPNPFSHGTFLHYHSPVAGRIELVVYDATGRALEAAAFSANAGSGRYYWQPKALTRGVYFLKATTPGGEAVTKVLMLE